MTNGSGRGRRGDPPVEMVLIVFWVPVKPRRMVSFHVSANDDCLKIGDIMRLVITKGDDVGKVSGVQNLFGFQWI